MNLLFITSTGRLELFEQILQNIFTSNRIDHILDPALRIQKCRLRNPEKQGGLAVDFLEITQQFLDQFPFCPNRQTVNNLDEEFDQAVNDFSLPKIKENPEQGISDFRRMLLYPPRTFTADTLIIISEGLCAG